MKIESEKYVIATIDKLIMFNDGNGYDTDYIDEAYLYNNKEDAEKTLKTYDNPSEYQVLKILITYEL